MRTTVALAALAAATVFAQQPATISSCSPYIKWSSLKVTPSSPQAGDTVSINGTGVISANVVGGGGTINAYLFGADVFVAPINTCGAGQQIDVLGITTGVLDALACPVKSGAAVSFGFVLPIPQEASGLGDLLIEVASNNTGVSQQEILCLNLTVSL